LILDFDKFFIPQFFLSFFQLSLKLPRHICGPFVSHQLKSLTWFEGRDPVLIEVQSQHSPGGTEMNLADPANFRTKFLPKTSSYCYRYENLLGKLNLRSLYRSVLFDLLNNFMILEPITQNTRYKLTVPLNPVISNTTATISLFSDMGLSFINYLLMQGVNKHASRTCTSRNVTYIDIHAY
jgi:hypothetical protein